MPLQGRQSFNIASSLSISAQEQADSPALIPPGLTREQAWSFSELQKTCLKSAAYLSKRGIVPGSKTLVLRKPGTDLILTVFALFKIGAIPIIIDPGIGYRKFINCITQLQPDAMVGIPQARILRLINPSAFSSIHTAVIDSSKGFMKKINAIVPPDTDILYDCQPDSMAAILFTSGSTGPAKGVVYTHRILNEQCRMIKEEYAINRGEIDLPLLPVFALFNPALGMCTVVPEMNASKPATLKPEKIVASIRRNEVSNSFGSPALWTIIGRYCKNEGITLPSIKRILMAGAPVPAELVELMKPIIPNGIINTPYGATEALPVSTLDGDSVVRYNHPDRQARGICVGKAFKGMTVKIIKPSPNPIDTLTPDLFMPENAVGEVIVKGPIVTAAYYKREDASRQAKILKEFDPESDIPAPALWHRMGDLGYIDKDRQLWFCGRLAERVYSGTSILDTVAVENIFNKHPFVYRSALIGIGKKGNQTPAVVIEPEKGAWPKGSKETSKFIESLKTLGSPHSHTRSINIFFFKKALPVDPRHNAKIHRLALAKEFASSKDGSISAS